MDAGEVADKNVDLYLRALRLIESQRAFQDDKIDKGEWVDLLALEVAEVGDVDMAAYLGALSSVAGILAHSVTELTGEPLDELMQRLRVGVMAQGEGDADQMRTSDDA